MAVNSALVAPAGTATVVGTVTAALLLVRLMDNPPFGAALFSATVQLSVPAPAKDPLVQVSELGVVSALTAAVPSPLSPIIRFPPPEESLATATCPEAVPVAAGVNLRLRL